MERRLHAGGATRSALRAELGACSPLDRAEDQAELLGALQALVGGAVQYDAQAGVPLSVRGLCGLLLEGRSNRSRSAPYHGLRRAVQVSGPACGLRRGGGLGSQGILLCCASFWARRFLIHGPSGGALTSVKGSTRFANVSDSVTSFAHLVLSPSPGLQQSSA